MYQVTKQIHGTMLDLHNKPLKNKMIYLYKINSSNQLTLIAITFTNQLGQYYFGNKIKGKYIIKINSDNLK